jgi:hypothetical protein
VGTLGFVSGAFYGGVDVDAHSFTAGTGDRVYAAILAGFNGGSADTLRDIIASNGTTVLEADDDGAIGSASHTGDTIVVIVDVAPERAAPQWSVIDGIGVFSGSFIINCNRSGRRNGLRIE